MKDKIANYIKDHITKESVSEIQGHQDLLGSGLVDSLGMMKLIAFIEKEAYIKVPPEDMTIENFMTIDQILEYIATQQNS